MADPQDGRHGAADNPSAASSSGTGANSNNAMISDIDMFGSLTNGGDLMITSNQAVDSGSMGTLDDLNLFLNSGTTPRESISGDLLGLGSAGDAGPMQLDISSLFTPTAGAGDGGILDLIPGGGNSSNNINNGDNNDGGDPSNLLDAPPSISRFQSDRSLGAANFGMLGGGNQGGSGQSATATTESQQQGAGGEESNANLDNARALVASLMRGIQPSSSSPSPSPLLNYAGGNGDDGNDIAPLSAAAELATTGATLPADTTEQGAPAAIEAPSQYGRDQITPSATPVTASTPISGDSKTASSTSSVPVAFLGLSMGQDTAQAAEPQQQHATVPSAGTEPVPAQTATIEGAPNDTELPTSDSSTIPTEAASQLPQPQQQPPVSEDLPINPHLADFRDQEALSYHPRDDNSVERIRDLHAVELQICRVLAVSQDILSSLGKTANTIAAATIKDGDTYYLEQQVKSGAEGIKSKIADFSTLLSDIQSRLEAHFGELLRHGVNPNILVPFNVSLEKETKELDACDLVLHELRKKLEQATGRLASSASVDKTEMEILPSSSPLPPATTGSNTNT